MTPLAGSEPPADATEALTLADIHRALTERALRKLRLADELGVLLMRGIAPDEIRQRLNVSEKQYDRAAELLRHALEFVTVTAQPQVNTTGHAEWLMLKLPQGMRDEAQRLVDNAERVATKLLEGFKPSEVQRELHLSDEDYERATEWFKDALARQASV